MAEAAVAEQQVGYQEAAEAYYPLLASLASVCDGAATKDDLGFNATHTNEGRWLAFLGWERWGPAEVSWVYEALRVYKDTQLPDGAYEALPAYRDVTAQDERTHAAVRDTDEYRKGYAEAQERERQYQQEQRERKAAEAEAAEVAQRSVDLLESGNAAVRFPKRMAIVERMRELPDWRKFRPAEGDAEPYWEVQLTRGNADVLASLADFSFSYSPEAQAAITEAQAAEPKPDRRIEREGEALRFYWDRGLADWSTVKDAVASLPARRFVRDEQEPYWLVPVSGDAVPAIRMVLDAHFSQAVEPEVAAWLDAVTDQAASRLEASRSADGTVPELEGYRSVSGYEPYRFQIAGVAYALAAKRCIIADVMGLGKTIQALLVAHVADAYPACFLVPASVKLNWQREANEWIPGKRVQVLNGTKDEVDPEADVYVANYDIAKHYVDALVARGLRLLVLDESHYIKSPKAQRSVAAMALAYGWGYEEAKQRQAKRQGLDTRDGVEYRLCLSGTPLTNRPAELINQLRYLGRFKALFGGWYRYVMAYCDAVNNGYGWDIRGAKTEALPELNRIMRQDCYIRRDETEARLDLPDLVSVPVPLPLSNRAKYNRAAADIVSYVGAVAAARGRREARLKGLDPQSAEAKAEREAQLAEDKAARAEQLVRMQKLRSLVAQGKLAAAMDWVQDWLRATEDNGDSRKLVLFVHHREAQQAALQALTEAGERDGYKVARIFGSDSAAQRQANIDQLQQDPQTRVMVASLMAAREGITLTASNAVAFLELDWVPGTHMQAERRVLRIGQTEATCFAYYLLAEQTTDDVLAQVIETKRRDVTAAADGVLTDEDPQAGTMSALLSYLVGQYEQAAA